MDESLRRRRRWEREAREAQRQAALDGRPGGHPENDRRMLELTRITPSHESTSSQASCAPDSRTSNAGHATREATSRAATPSGRRSSNSTRGRPCARCSWRIPTKANACAAHTPSGARRATRRTPGERPPDARTHPHHCRTNRRAAKPRAHRTREHRTLDTPQGRLPPALPRRVEDAHRTAPVGDPARDAPGGFRRRPTPAQLTPLPRSGQR